MHIALFSLGVVGLACAVLLLLAGSPGAIPFGLVGIVLVIGTVFERAPYKPAEQTRPGPQWRQTGERFIDPVSGKPVTVFIDPNTGERRYVQSQP